MTNSIMNRRARLAGTTALAAVLCTTLPAASDSRWANIVNDAITETSAPAKPIKVVKTPGNLSALKRKPTNLTVKLDLDAKSSTKTSSFATALPTREQPVRAAKEIAASDRVQPRISIQAQSGNERTLGTADVFLPFYQTRDSVAFVDLRGVGTSEEEFEGNFGLGYRQVVGDVFGEELIVGGYGFFDIRQSPNDNTYYQGTAGVEFITDTFELRANGYLPNSDVNVVSAGQSVVQLNGTTAQLVQTNQVVEFALPGFDVEAGVKLDLTEDLRVSATGGYFHFERDGQKAAGPKVRAQIEYSDPFGLDGFSLALGAEFRDDDLRGSDTSGFVRFSIPLSANPTPRRELSQRAKNLGQYVYRDVDILAPTTVEEIDGGAGAQDIVGAAADPNSAPGTPSAEGETINLYHVTEVAQGAADCSSAANACTVATAQADPNYGAGDTLILVDSGGALIASDIALTAPLQNIVGADASGRALITLPDAAGSQILLTGLGGRTTIEGTVSPFDAASLARFNIDGGEGAAISIDRDLGIVPVNIFDVDIIGGEIGIDIASSALGSINVDAASSISGTSLSAFRLKAPTFESSFAGSIEHTGFGPAISVQDHATGDLAFTGPIEIRSIGSMTGLQATEDSISSLDAGNIEGNVKRVQGGIEFLNADSTYDIAGPITLSDANAGIFIGNDSSGTFTFNEIQGSSFGPTFRENGGTANVAFTGAVTQTGSFGSIIDIEDKTGGSNTFAGLVSGDLGRARGISLEDNAGTVAFTGGIDISTETGTAFFAGGQGGLSVNGGTSSLSTENGIALSLSSNTIAADGVSFDTITSSGIDNPNTPISVNANGGGDIGLGNVSIAGTASEDVLAPPSKELAAITTVEPLFIDGVFIGNNSNTITASSMTIDNVSGDGIEINNNPGVVTIDTVDIDGSNEAAVFITDSNGSVTISDGTVGSSSTNEFGLAILRGAGDVTFGADITQNGGSDAVFISEITGGSVSVTGTVETDAHSDATGVFLSDNTGGTVTFDGNMTLAGTGGGIIALDNAGGTYTFNGFVDVDNAAPLTAPLSELELAPLGVALLNTEEPVAGAVEAAPIQDVEPAIIPGPTYNFLGGLDVNVTEGVAFIAADLNDVLGPQITVNTADVSSNRITTDTGIAVEMVDVNVGDTGFNLASIDAGVSEATPVLFAGVTGGNVRVGNVTIAGTAGDLLIKGPPPQENIGFIKEVIPINLKGEPLDAMVVADSSAIFDFTLVTIGTEKNGASGDGLVLDSNTGDITIGSVDINNGQFDGLLIEQAAGNITINGGNIGGTNVNGGSVFIVDTQATGNITLNNVTVVAQTGDLQQAAVEPNPIAADDPFTFDLHPTIENNAGSITTTGGSFTNRGAGPALEITGNSGTISIGSTIVNTTDGPSVFGTALDIDTITDGTVTITGDVTRDGLGAAIVIGDLFFPDGALTGGTVNINGAVTATNGATIDIDKIGTNATVNFNGPVTVTDTGFAGILIQDVNGALNFTGTGENGTEITGGMFAGAISTNGTIGGSVSFADVDVTVASGSSNGVIDLADTSITGSFSITDLDIVAELPDGVTESFDRAGVDLSGTTGGGQIKLGDNTVTGGESASIGEGLSIGVLTSATTNVNFTFGDGEGDIDKGSTIDADVAISANPGPAGGTYNFEDVLFDEAAEFDFPATGDSGELIFVANTATGDGSGKDLDNLITGAGADSVTGAATFVLVNDGNTISTDSNGFNLEDDQNIDGFGNGNSITAGQGAPEGFTGVPSTLRTFTHDGGAATLQSSLAGGVIISGSSTIENVNIDANGFSVAAIRTNFSDTISGANIVVQDLSINATGGADALDLLFDQADSNIGVTVRNVDIVGNTRITHIGSSTTPVQNDIVVSISDSSFNGDNEFTQALDLRSFNALDASTITVTDLSNNAISGIGNGGGANFENVTFDADLGTVGSQTVQGGTFQIGEDAANRIEGNGLRLFRPEGDLAFTPLNVFNDGGTGLIADTEGGATTFNINVQGGVINTINGAAFFIN